MVDKLVIYIPTIFAVVGMIVLLIQLERAQNKNFELQKQLDDSINKASLQFSLGLDRVLEELLEVDPRLDRNELRQLLSVIYRISTEQFHSETRETLESWIQAHKQLLKGKL